MWKNYIDFPSIKNVIYYVLTTPPPFLYVKVPKCNTDVAPIYIIALIMWYYYLLVFSIIK